MFCVKKAYVFKVKKQKHTEKNKNHRKAVANFLAKKSYEALCSLCMIGEGEELTQQQKLKLA